MTLIPYFKEQALFTPVEEVIIEDSIPNERDQNVNNSCLAVCLLGPFEASLDGQPLKFRSDKIRALLAYLLVEGHTPHPSQRW